MFLIDDLLLAPARGFAAICQKIHDAAKQDLEAQEKSILAELSELHQLIEGGRISEQDFNRRETVLLDRLEAIQDVRTGGSARGKQGED